MRNTRNTNRFLSPRLSNAPIIPQSSMQHNFDRSILSKALLEKIAMTPKPEWFQDQTGPAGCSISPKPQVGITLETVKAQRPEGTQMREDTKMMQSGTINSEHSTLVDNNEENRENEATGISYKAAA